MESAIPQVIHGKMSCMNFFFINSDVFSCIADEAKYPEIIINKGMWKE
ncbi:MAG: hypothetical protein RR206_09095 [Bacteroidaceae bacterium]